MISTSRPESLAPRDGHDLPAPPWRTAVLTLLALGCGTALTIGLARATCHSYTGYLQAKCRTVTAGRDACIVRILAPQGSVADPGAPLLVLSDLELEARRADKERELSARRAELSQARAKAAVEVAALKQRIEAEIFDVKFTSAHYLGQTGSENNITKIEFVPIPKAKSPRAPDKHVTLARHVRPEAFEVGQSLAGAARQRDNMFESAPANRAHEIELCNSRLAALERNLDQLPEEILEATGVNVARAHVERAEEELERLNGQERALTITAEAHGTVGLFRKQIGDHVAAHEPIVDLLDEDQPYLVLQIPSDELVHFAPGTMLELRFPGGIRGKGKVASIPPQTAPLPGPERDVVKRSALLTVHIAPAGPVWPELPFGSAVEIRR